ncbi:MAG: gene transfer agent family protein [Marinicaulis sp.]|nr:gene transfer agent family protein [Marinicaulis sp.]
MTHPSNISIKINGADEQLRLTLGALASIETAFGGDLGAMKERLMNPRISDILFILHALLAGGGSLLTLEVLRASDLDITDAARGIAKSFETLGKGGAPGKSQAGNQTETGAL